jgi:hypothetical protein
MAEFTHCDPWDALVRHTCRSASKVVSTHRHTDPHMARVGRSLRDFLAGEANHAGTKEFARGIVRLPAVFYRKSFGPLISRLMLMPICQENELKAKLTLRVYPTVRLR